MIDCGTGWLSTTLGMMSLNSVPTPFEKRFCPLLLILQPVNVNLNTMDSSLGENYHDFGMCPKRE